MGQQGHYDLIISYAHEDKLFAETLCAALLAYRPLFKLNGKRRLNVFLDSREADSAHLNDALERAINNSDKIIVICSAAARNSSWVNWEVGHFITTHGTENVIPVLIEGEPDTTFPPALAELTREAWAVDFRQPPAKLRDNRDSWFHLLAALYSVSRTVIENREFNKKLYLAGLSLAAIVIMAAAAIVFYAQKQRTASIDLARQASLPYTDALSFEQRVKSAVSALETYDTPQARNVLQSLLQAYFDRDGAGGSMNLYFVINQSEWLFYSNVLGGNYLYNLRTHESRLLFRDMIPTWNCMSTPDGKYLITINSGGQFRIWDLSSSLLKTSIIFNDQQVGEPHIDLSGDGKFLYAHLSHGDTTFEKKWSVPDGKIVRTDTVVESDDDLYATKDELHHALLFTDFDGASLTDSDYIQKRAFPCDIRPYRYCKILQYNSDKQLALLKLSNDKLPKIDSFGYTSDTGRIFGLMAVGRQGNHRLKVIVPSFENFDNLLQWFPGNDTLKAILYQAISVRYSQFTDANSTRLPGTNLLLLVNEPFLDTEKAEHAGLFEATGYRLLDTLPWNYGSVKYVIVNKDKSKAVFLSQGFESKKSYLTFWDLALRRLISLDTSGYTELKGIKGSDHFIATKGPVTDRDTTKNCFWRILDFYGNVFRQSNHDHYFNQQDWLGINKDIVVAGNYDEFYLWSGVSKEPRATVVYERPEKSLFALDKILLGKSSSAKDLLKIARDWVSF